MSDWRWSEDKLWWSNGDRSITLELLVAEGMTIGDARLGGDALEVERKYVHGQIDELYWKFTRTKRGRPPCIVRPDLYERRRTIDRSLRVWNHVVRQASPRATRDV